MSLEFELVLPCYNESKSIELLIQQAITAAKAAGYNARQFKLVLVENGSKDDSRIVLERLSATDLGDWFSVVKIDLNQGYGFGLDSGLRSTRAQYVGWSHADQQCSPHDAFVALSKLKESRSDRILVKGIRVGRDSKDRFVSHVFEMITWAILGTRFYEINAQPKVFPRALLNEVRNPPNGFEFDLYVLYCAKKAGYDIASIPVLFPKRIHGVSNWASNFLSRYKTIFRMIRYVWRLSRSPRTCR